MDVLFSLETDDKFKLVAEDVINKYCNNPNTSTILDEDVIIKIKEEINDLIFKSNGNKQMVVELLLSKGYVEERIEIFSSLIEEKQNKLMYIALVNYNSAFGETIDSCDWALKLIYGTSELKKLNYPLVQLAFTTVNKTEMKQRIYDVNKDMLTKLINILENIDTLEHNSC